MCKIKVLYKAKYCAIYKRSKCHNCATKKRTKKKISKLDKTETKLVNECLFKMNLFNNITMHHQVTMCTTKQSQKQQFLTQIVFCNNTANIQCTIWWVHLEHVFNLVMYYHVFDLVADYRTFPLRYSTITNTHSYFYVKNSMFHRN